MITLKCFVKVRPGIFTMFRVATIGLATNVGISKLCFYQELMSH